MFLYKLNELIKECYFIYRLSVFLCLMVYKNVRLYVCRRLYLFPFGNIMLKTSIIGKSHYLSPG